VPGSKELTEEERDELEDLLRGMVFERKTIREGMGFCITRSSSAIEIVQTISEALTLDETPAPKKIARLFLLSDILHNALGAAAQVAAGRRATGVVPRDAHAYRASFQRHLPDIFVSLHGCLARLDSRMAVETMKEQVVKVLYVWQVESAHGGKCFGFVSFRLGAHRHRGSPRPPPSSPHPMAALIRPLLSSRRLPHPSQCTRPRRDASA
jgi:hypothetical protein